MKKGSTTAGSAQTPVRPSPLAPLDSAFATQDPRALVRFLHDDVRLSDRELSKALGGIHEVTIRRWRSKSASSMPRETASLDDVRAIVALLLRSGMLYPEEIGRFLRARNEDLGHQRPLDLLGMGSEKEFYRVLEAAELLIKRLQAL